MIAARVAELRRKLNIPVEVSRRGPVPLELFFSHLDVTHTAIPGLTLGAVTEALQADLIPIEDLGEPTTKLAGFLFCSSGIGRAFVNADEILSRRRFSAAHELGHYVLHQESMKRFRFDTEKTLLEAEPARDPQEAEANKFAAELLMPRDVIEARADEMMSQFHACPRYVLAYQLASELLVSRDAMRYRLKTLEVGDDT